MFVGVGEVSYRGSVVVVGASVLMAAVSGGSVVVVVVVGASVTVVGTLQNRS